GVFTPDELPACRSSSLSLIPGYRELSFSANRLRSCLRICGAPVSILPRVHTNASLFRQNVRRSHLPVRPLFLIVLPPATNQIMVQKMFKPLGMYEKWMSRQRRFFHSPLESQVHANGLSAAMHVQFF